MKIRGKKKGKCSENNGPQLML